MTNFYDEWLGARGEAEEAFRRSPLVARDGDVPWIETRQDAKVKLMVSNEVGYPTMGGSVLKAEIPAGWHTGKHRHGEESIHILKGSGFNVVNGKRFDWHHSSTLQIPFGAEHQHFNTGDEPAQYVSAMCFPLERFLHIGRLDQLEDCGANDATVLAAIPAEESQCLGERRVVIHIEQADNRSNRPHQDSSVNQTYDRRTLIVKHNGFDAHTVAITHIFIEPGHFHTGRHRHLEAVLYALEGEGVSEFAGNFVPWKAGDVLHVPPAGIEHQHYNTTGVEHKMLCIEFGIRFWFTDAWPEGFAPQRVLDAEGEPIVAGPLATE